MSASPEIETVVASSLDEAYGHVLAKMVPVVSDQNEGGDVLLFAGEGESPDAALADALEAIRDLAETHGGTPAQVALDGSLRTDAGYRLWGSVTLGDGDVMDATATVARIEQGEEGDMDGHDHAELNMIATSVVIDFAANTLHLRVPDLPSADAGQQEALLDVGANGRLIGLELGDLYITVMGLPADGDPLARSASVQVEVAPGPEIVLPRRGPGYEITYPSGNECWQMKNVNGTLVQVCATTAGEPPEPPVARGPSTAPGRHRQ